MTVSFAERHQIMTQLLYYTIGEQILAYQKFSITFFAPFLVITLPTMEDLSIYREQFTKEANEK